MIRMSVYSIDTVAAAMDNKGVLEDGAKFKPNSHRMQLFFTNGFDCVTCGIAGAFFALETHHSHVKPHLNLYAVNASGNEILMTKDHIIPRSKGGANELQNYQTMCSPCNMKKSDKL